MDRAKQSEGKGHRAGVQGALVPARSCGAPGKVPSPPLGLLPLVLPNPDQRGKRQKSCQVFQQECWQLPHPSGIWQNLNHSTLGSKPFFTLSPLHNFTKDLLGLYYRYKDKS